MQVIINISIMNSRLIHDISCLFQRKDMKYGDVQINHFTAYGGMLVIWPFSL